MISNERLTKSNMKLKMKNKRTKYENSQLKNDFEKMKKNDHKVQSNNNFLKETANILLEENQKMKNKNNYLQKEYIHKSNEKMKLENEMIQLTKENKQLKSNLEFLSKNKRKSKASANQIMIKENFHVNGICNQYDNLAIEKYSSILPLQYKQAFFSKLSFTATNEMDKQFYTNINRLIAYLIEFKQLKALVCFNINKYEVTIFSETLHILVKNDAIDSNEFISILNDINKCKFQIHYPLKLFQKIFDSLIDIKNAFLNKDGFKIDIVISELDDNNFFRYEKNIHSIIIDDNVNEIKESYFDNCSMTEILLPSTILSIQPFSFSGCTYLTQFSIPPSVTVIKKGLFRFCYSLKTIIIPESVTDIEEQVFKDCRSLTEVNIPFSVKKIKPFTFTGCSSLKNITLPSIESIGEYAFNECSSLENIFLSSSCQTIGKSAFNKCVSLFQISIPSSVIEIDSYAFCGCSKLKKSFASNKSENH